MKWAIRGGTIVTGDGNTVIENGTIVIDEERIIEVTDKNLELPADVKSIDAAGKVVMPGIINNHVHCVIDGAPIFASAAPSLPTETIFSNLDRHLLEGTTTLLNVDGFATMEEVESTNDRHPINIKTGTIHTPRNIKAAYMGDGKGMKPENEKPSVEEMLRRGAVAIAEVGAGATLGGGVQEYMYIPRAVKQVTGVEITKPQARALKSAVLGKYIDPPVYDETKLTVLMDEFGLTDKITAAGLKKVVEYTVLPPFEDAIAGLIEAGEYAARLDTIVSIHHAAPTKEVTKKLAYLGKLLVAGHSNHHSFDTDEAIEACQWLKERDVIIDVSTLDTFGARQMATSTDTLYGLVRAGLVDTISTDYGGGKYDPIVVCLDYLVTDGVCSLPQAVAMATSNVARLFPGLAADRGVLAPGKVADIILVDANSLGQVNTVIISGRTVAKGGKVCY